MILEYRNDDYNSFLNKWKSERSFVQVVYSYINRHPKNNKIALILVRFIDSGDSYILVINHTEGDSLNLTKTMTDMANSDVIKYCIDKKYILQTTTFKNLTDLAVEKYTRDGSIFNMDDYLTAAHRHIYSESEIAPLNELVPILKHKETFDNLYDDHKEATNFNVPSFYNRVTIPVLAKIESYGLYVAQTKFIGKVKDVDSNKLVYTDYNIYTSSSRPSNAYGGVNFSALNKTDGTRSFITSRFGDEGKLVLMDFDAYHIRLIASLIDYEINQPSGHQWLASQYFPDEDITEEKYESAKAMTFRLLYGGISEDIANKIPFFKKVAIFIDSVWQMANRLGHYSAPISGRNLHLDAIKNNNKQKFFSYLLQSMETDRNMLVMGDVLFRIMNMKSKLVLYTYDSFLFDVHNSEYDFVVNELKDSIEKYDENIYPLHISVGTNYNSMNAI